MNALFLLYINVREILFGRCLIDYKVRIGEWVLIFFFFFFVDRSNNCECSRYRTHSRASWVPSSECYATILIICYLVAFSENYSPLGLGDLVRQEQSEVSHPTTHLK